MSDDLVNASPADIRRLASALNTYKQDVAQASNRVRGALRSANWNDRRKAQFEARYQDLQKNIDRFMSGEVDEMVRMLNDLAQRLDDIRQIRL